MSGYAVLRIISPRRLQHIPDKDPVPRRRDRSPAHGSPRRPACHPAGSGCRTRVIVIIDNTTCLYSLFICAVESQLLSFALYGRISREKGVYFASKDWGICEC